MTNSTFLTTRPLRRDNNRAIHTTLYRVCCIEYTLGCLRTLNSIFRIPNAFFFFLAFKQFDKRETNTTFEKHMKTYTHSFHSHNLIA